MRQSYCASILIFALLISDQVNAQNKTLTFPLKIVSDSTANSFNYILPEKIDFKVALPKIDMQNYSLSRSLKFASFNKMLYVIVGKDKKGINFIVFDANDNQDLSDDEIVYFTDSLTSPTKGNYKHFRSNISLNGKDIPLNFDYSIIKPKALNISFKDSIENNIHLMVRPSTYGYTEVEYENIKYPVVVFTKNVYDHSKKSTFLISASQKLGIDSLKQLISRGASKFVPGDIALLGGKKFLFEGLTPFGDSIIVSSREEGSDTYGTKVGFIARNFNETDIISGKSLALNAMKGKYVLLDFWGTWCAPCIQIMDDIKKLHQNVDSSKMAMIGVCYDDNVAKVKTFIQKRGIDWNQIFDRRSQSTMGKLFDITTYPSFVLIDPQGKIVFRDEGINGFQRLNDQLPELLKK
jgi:thiol-disulfide isomerase/thioredoxin